MTTNYGFLRSESKELPILGLSDWDGERDLGVFWDGGVLRIHFDSLAWQGPSLAQE